MCFAADFLNDLHEYHIATRTWRDLSVPTGGTPAPVRWNSRLASSGGLLYTFGGIVKDGAGILLHHDSASVVTPCILLCVAIFCRVATWCKELAADSASIVQE